MPVLQFGADRESDHGAGGERHQEERPLQGSNAQQMRQFATGLRKYVHENADYVGPDFAEEARKIHYGETPSRHIYGEATHKDAQELIEEGVDVAPSARS